jgi:hypothetical protein
MTRACDLCGCRTCVCEPLPEPNPDQERIDRERDQRARAFWERLMAERADPEPKKRPDGRWEIAA